MLILPQFCVGDPENQDFPRQVIIEQRTPLPELTEGFHDPNILLGSGTDFFRSFEQFNLTYDSASAGRPVHALLIRTHPSKYLIIMGLLGCVLLSLAVGLLAGLLGRDTKIGFIAAGAAITLCSMTHAYLFGMKFLG